MPKPDRPRPQDAPRWRCDECGRNWFELDDPNDLRCYSCCSGTLRSAPSLAVERAERVVVRAAMYSARNLCAEDRHFRLDESAKKLMLARARARLARKSGTN